MDVSDIFRDIWRNVVEQDIPVTYTFPVLDNVRYRSFGGPRIKGVDFKTFARLRRVNKETKNLVDNFILPWDNLDNGAVWWTIFFCANNGLFESARYILTMSGGHGLLPPLTGNIPELKIKPSIFLPYLINQKVNPKRKGPDVYSYCLCNLRATSGEYLYWNWAICSSFDGVPLPSIKGNESIRTDDLADSVVYRHSSFNHQLPHYINSASLKNWLSIPGRDSHQLISNIKRANPRLKEVILQAYANGQIHFLTYFTFFCNNYGNQLDADRLNAICSPLARLPFLQFLKLCKIRRDKKCYFFFDYLCRSLVFHKDKKLKRVLIFMMMNSFSIKFPKQRLMASDLAQSYFTPDQLFQYAARGDYPKEMRGMEKIEEKDLLKGVVSTCCCKEVLDWVFSRHDPSRDDQKLLEDAVLNDRSELVEHLMSDPRMDPTANNNRAIFQAWEMMKKTKVNGWTLSHLLKHPKVDPNTFLDIFYESIKFKWYNVFTALLDNPRFDPSVHKQKAFMDAIESKNEEMTKLLSNHPKVRNYPDLERTVEEYFSSDSLEDRIPFLKGVIVKYENQPEKKENFRERRRKRRLTLGLPNTKPKPKPTETSQPPSKRFKRF